MSKETGTAVPAPASGIEPTPGGPAVEPTLAEVDDDRSVTVAPGAPLLTLLALGWLGGMVWSARTTVATSTVDAMATTAAAYALPGIISASLASGAAAGLLPVGRLGGRG